MLRLSPEAYTIIHAANYRYQIFGARLPVEDQKLVGAAKAATTASARDSQLEHDPTTCVLDTCYVCLVVHRSPHWSRNKSLSADMKATNDRLDELRLQIYASMSKQERRSLLTERENLEAETLRFRRAGSDVLDVLTETRS